MLKRIVVTAMAIAFPVMLLVGCGGPPKEDIEKTAMNKKKAMEAKADSYSKDMFDAAAAAETAGADAVKKSDWDKAKKSYMDAAKKYDDAAKAAPEGMKKATDDATAMATTMNKDMETMNKDKAMMAMAMKMKKEDKAKHDADMKAMTEMMKDASGMVAADPMGAMEKMNTVKAKMDEMKASMTPKKK